MHFWIRSKTGLIIIPKECGRRGRPAIVGSAKIDFPKVHEHVTMQELFEGEADALILQVMKELLELMQLRTVEQTAILLRLLSPSMTISSALRCS